MKKFILSLLVVFAAITASADNYLSSGDVKILKDQKSTFSVEYDFIDAVVEGVPYKEYVASRPAEWQRDWPSDREAGREVFVERWNKKNRGGMKATLSSGGRYRLVIKPTYINFGSAALAWTIGFGAGGMCMSGTVELYDNDEKVLVIKVDNQTGKSKLTETKRFKSLMEELADDVYKDVVK